MEEEDGEEVEDGDLAEETVHDFGEGVFFADGEVGDGVAGVEDIVVGAPEGAPAFAAHGADFAVPCVGEAVAGGPVDDAVGFDFSEAGGAGGVGEEFDVFAEAEELLAGVEDGAAVGVGDVDAGGESEDAEGDAEGEGDAVEVSGEGVGGGWGRGDWGGVGIGGVGGHGAEIFWQE